MDRVRLDRDAFWAQALSAYRDGFQWLRTDEELAEIVSCDAGYDIQDLGSADRGLHPQ